MLPALIVHCGWSTSLQMRSYGDLLRACDNSPATRNKPCEIFWTLGANQVGKAAIAGWRDLLAPALRDKAIAIWPFDGDLPVLFEAGGNVKGEWARYRLSCPGVAATK